MRDTNLSYLPVWQWVLKSTSQISWAFVQTGIIFQHAWIMKNVAQAAAHVLSQQVKETSHTIK